MAVIIPHRLDTGHLKSQLYWKILGFPGDTVVKIPPANAEDGRDLGLISASGRSLRGGHGNPLQHSRLGTFLENFFLITWFVGAKIS